MTDDEIQQLRDETQMTDRAHEQNTFDSETFVDALVDELARIEDGASSTYSARDEHGMAILEALEQHDEAMDVLLDGLEGELGRELGEIDKRSDLVRLLLRAGLASAAPELWEALQEAAARQASQSV